MLAVAAACLLVVPLHFGRTVQASLQSAPQFVNQSLPVGLVDAADFLRTYSATTDVVQNNPLSKDVAALRDYPVLNSLAERPSYLGRSATFWSTYYAGSADDIEAQRRTAVLDQLRSANEAESFRAMASKIGIDWFVFGPDDQPSWPTGVPAFESHGYIVYRISNSTE